MITQQKKLKQRLQRRSSVNIESSGDNSVDNNEVKTTTAINIKSNTLVQRQPSIKKKRPDTDNPPDVNVALINLVAVQGNLLVFKLENDTFYDREDGGMENLKFKVVELRGDKLVEETWLKMDGISLYGVPPNLGSEQVYK